jgi:hypothetical protein
MSRRARRARRPKTCAQSELTTTASSAQRPHRLGGVSVLCISESRSARLPKPAGRGRIDQVLFAAVMEAYVHAVSTRKVDGSGPDGRRYPDKM